MCGIAGFIGFRDDRLINEFSQLLKHRGPDGEGFFCDDYVTLLNRRLAIIDIAGGDQPIYNEDRTMVIVYNGEIYNYQDLRSELEKKGHVINGLSDTEVILHGYEEWGDDNFNRLNGMFAVAIYDIKKKRTILARDHFGIKPLYFSFFTGTNKYKRNGLMFSSEIKPLIYSGLIPVFPNDQIIYRYLNYRIHDDGRETFFKGVERLLPGEMMKIEDGKHEIKCFSKLPQTLLQKPETKHNNPLQNHSILSFKSLLIDSIKRRLISEVPVGTCLSGGLDSSTVVAVVNKLLKEKIGETKSVGDIQKTFSAVFPGSANDEEKYIDEVTMLKVKSYKVRPTSKEFSNDLEDFIKTQEEPTISTGPYAQYKVMQEAHKHVTVVLDGQGADEMMAGYIPYYFVYLRQLWQEHKYFSFFNEAFSANDIISKFIFKNRSREVKVQSLLNKEFIAQFKTEKFYIENSNLKKRLIQDIFKNSLQSLLRYEDKNAMRFSIEGRVPFLDVRLLKHIFSLPDDAIIKDGWNKYILRQSTTDLLPYIINKRRNKIGFTTPEHEWFKKMHKEILDVFTGELFLSKKYVNQAEVVIAYKDFLAGKTKDTMVFWRILNLELWMREFISNKSQTSNLKKINKNIIVQGKEYVRHPIRTDVFEKGDGVARKISSAVLTALKKLTEAKLLSNKKYFVVVSEKVVAVAQGRAYFIWDIKPSFWAKLLSRFVRRVPWGIGLGSPWTMELAIKEVGLLRVLLASILGGVGKLLGMRGIFYKIAGRAAAGIDGPTEYSLYPANVSAKLLPKEPQKVCEDVEKSIKYKVESSKSGFLGVAIIDANDIGRNVLGNSTSLSSKLIEDIFQDNPMGQTNEQTPLTIVICE